MATLDAVMDISYDQLIYGLRMDRSKNVRGVRKHLVGKITSDSRNGGSMSDFLDFLIQLPFTVFSVIRCPLSFLTPREER